MKHLNLTNLEKSDIKYQLIKFPDGQQNIIINPTFEKDEIDSVGLGNVKNEKILIKSRLNNFKDLELIICAAASLRELKVKEIHLYTPYIMGARSDRKFEEGGNRYIKDVLAPIINSLKFESVTCINPHSYVLENCINNFKSESNWTLLARSIESIPKKLNRYEDQFVLVAPDAGAAHKIYKSAQQINFKGDIINCTKERDNEGRLTKTVVPMSIDYWNTKDKIIIDDICDGGATFINIAKEFKKEAYQQKNKSKIYLIVTHGIFSKGLEHVMEHFDGIFCTNSYSDTIYCPNITDEIGAEVKLFKQLNVF